MEPMQQATPTDRREQLLESVVDHVLAHGIAHATLRGLATAVSSNNRMLIYYFGSLDELIVAALHRAEVRFVGMTTIFDDFGDRRIPLRTRLESTWATIADPRNRPFHRLFFEIFGLAGFERERFSELLGVIGTEWADILAAAYADEGLSSEAAAAYAHETVALWRGFQATLLSLDDDAVVERAARPALASLAARIEAEASRS